MTLSAHPLAQGFPQVGHKDWLAMVETVLKGQSFDRRLVKLTADGIAVQPIYTAENAAPAAGPLFGARDLDRPWDLRSEIAHPNPVDAHRQALQELENGAASLVLRLDPTGVCGVAVASKADLGTVLDGVLLDLAPVALDAGFLGPQAGDWLGELGKMSPNAPLAFHMDPISAYASSGHSPGPIQSHIFLAAETGARWAAPYARASFVLASGRVAHEAGGSEGQELALALASALAYARAMVRSGLSMQDAFNRIVLGLSTDETYFNSIAKVRAARVLWNKLTAACGVDTPARIESRSSSRMLSTLDPWVNLLRLTAAGFAAGVGGADAVTLAAFTEPLGRPTDFARRQARNTQLVLMEEANLGRVGDPAAGAWYLETLTDNMARSAWSQFQTIEAQGGIVEALARGEFQKAIFEVRDKRCADIATRRTGIIGVTEFPTLTGAPVELDRSDPSASAKTSPRVQLPGPDSHCQPLAHWRAAEGFEQLRQQAAHLDTTPTAILATLGSARDFAARVGFSQNVLAAGGIASSTQDIARITLAECPLAVLCGADDAYLTDGESAARTLKKAGIRHLLVAGRPANAEALKAAGVDGFIFAGADLAVALSACLEVYS